MKSKRLYAIGLAVLLMTGVGLFSAWATQTATATVTIGAVATGMTITVDNANPFVPSGTCPPEGRHVETVNTQIWTARPPCDNDCAFMLTIYFNSEQENMISTLLAFRVTFDNGDSPPTVYAEGKTLSVSGTQVDNLIYVSPETGSETLYIQPGSPNNGYFHVWLETVSWSPGFPPTGPGSINLLLAGKALD